MSIEAVRSQMLFESAEVCVPPAERARWGLPSLELGPIPLYRPHLVGTELALMEQAVTSGQLSGDRAFTHRCHALLESVLKAEKVLLTTSCTHALEMAALLLELRPGDEVIVPAYTFVSTANAFALHGVRPVFVDIRPDTLNLDERLIEQAITPRTRAIVPVHYAGVGCEMDAIMAIATSRGLAVVEDNAHGLFGKYRGRYLGTFGALGTQSFHETKNFTCGEGGALVINDPRLIARAELIREKGTDRSRFCRGEIDKYTWRDVGSSFLPADILAAHLYAQLAARGAIQQRRRELFEFYQRELAGWAARSDVRLPTAPEHCEQAYHMFYLLMPSAAARTALIGHLAAQQIRATFHYVPLHSSPAGQRLGRGLDDCPVTSRVSSCLVRIPFFNDLTPEQLGRVVDAVSSFQP